MAEADAANGAGFGGFTDSRYAKPEGLCEFDLWLSRLHLGNFHPLVQRGEKRENRGLADEGPRRLQKCGCKPSQHRKPGQIGSRAGKSHGQGANS